jgi:hypothetical protein
LETSLAESDLLFSISSTIDFNDASSDDVGDSNLAFLAALIVLVE